MKKLLLILLAIGNMLLIGCEENTQMSQSKSSIEKDNTSTAQLDSNNVENFSNDKTSLKLDNVSDIDFGKYKNNEELVLSESPTATFVLTTDSVLEDFKIQSVLYDGIQCEVKNKDLYNKKVFDSNISLKIKAYIPETFSDILISYKKDGKICRNFIVSNLTGKGTPAKLQPGTIGGHIVADSYNDLSWASSVEEVQLCDEVNANFVFSSDSSLKNLEFISVSYNGEKCELKKTLHSVPTFNANAALKISTYLPDMMSNLLIRYKNQDGNTVNWLVNYNMSGEGAKVILENANSLFK